MKQVVLLIAIVALVSMAWFNIVTFPAGTVSAEVYSNFFLDVKVGQQVPAHFYSSAETLQEISCEGTEIPGFVSCQFPEEYAGQEVAVELTKNNVMYVSVVNVPAQ